MFKKINNCILIVLFLAVLALPLLFTRWESGGVSEAENRNLAQFPALSVDGAFNPSFTKEFETWFMDHMGLRQKLISFNTDLMKNVFGRSLTTSDYKIGKTGDSIYATDAIIKDFAHINLRSEKDVEKIGNSYQVISDWLAQKNIPFYYVQCVDKHTIYPERFISSVRQIGNISKTDQVMDRLENETTVHAIYFKYPMLEARDQYDVFSHWGDPTHWTDRGAYVSYRYMMDRLNQNMETPLKVLQEEDYKIGYVAHTGNDGQTEQIEKFVVANPKAQKADTSVMGKWGEDHRHSVWKNPEAGNNKRLLLMCDSYFNNHLVDDIAESFSEVWLVWGDYTSKLPQIVNLYDPDIVIYECAERVDRSTAICNLAKKLQSAD